MKIEKYQIALEDALKAEKIQPEWPKAMRIIAPGTNGKE